MSEPKPRPVRPGLPVALTAFVGRAREVATIRRLLRQHRLLTLVGPGGVGKTRLALALAGDADRSYPDGVWLVDLAPLRDASLVPSAMAASLGFPDAPRRSPAEGLVEALRRKRLLLVLDNCEHLVQACAGLVAELLRGCPDVRVLATSREPLGVPGEVAWRVPTLAVPGIRAEPSPSELRRCDSVQLFMDRARSVMPGFALDQHTAPIVGSICRRLEGWPLAIELAAARLSALSLEQVDARLADALSLLSAGPRTAPARQQTLRATLDWSYGLLAPDERRLFERLAVFAGPFTAEGAEAVCAEPDLRRENVLPTLSSLVAQSLVLVVSRDHEVAWYRLLEPVRQYAAEQLEGSGTAPAARRAHASFYVGLAERAGSELRGPSQQAWLARLRQEHDNLRSALGWSLAADPDLGLRLAAGLWPFWWSLGYASEGLRWLRDTLERASAAGPSVRARALEGAGHLSMLSEEPSSALGYLADSLSLWRKLGDERESARSSRALGDAHLHLGELDEAGVLLGESLAASREHGDEWGVIASLTSLGNLAYARRAYEEAAAAFAECLACARRCRDVWRAANSLHALGHLAWAQGHIERAGVLLGESLDLARALDDRRGMAVCLESLALVAISQELPMRAARLFGAATRLRAGAGAGTRPWLRADFERGMASLRDMLGDAAFEAAHLAGGSLEPEGAVAEALAGFRPEVMPNEGSDVGVEPGTGLLTRREGQVALLVARGLTNRQIGAALVITEGTANLHVKHILHKLGLGSRVELAAWVVARGGRSAGAEISRAGDGGGGSGP